MQNTALKAELNGQKIKIDQQIEQINRVENDKSSLAYQLNENSLAIINSLSSTNADLTTQISEQSQLRHQKDIDELLITHQEYQRTKDTSSQLSIEVVQLKNMVSFSCHCFDCIMTRLIEDNRIKSRNSETIAGAGKTERRSIHNE